MSSPLFVDTSAFLALADKSEPAHARAVEVLGHLDGPLVTSNLIVLEVATIVSRRGGRRKAIEILDRLKNEAGLKVYHVDPELEKKGWEIFNRTSRRDLDPTRAMSIALMRELNIRLAFTFDKAYKDAGFVTIPVGE